MSSVTRRPVPSRDEHGLGAAGGVRRDHEIVRAAGVAGGLESELARRVARKNVAREYAVGDEFAIARRDALLIERRAAHRLRDVRALGDRKARAETPAAPPRSAGTRTAGTGCCRESPR